MFFVYGNHDEEVDVPGSNRSGLSCLLPDGQVIDTGRAWECGSTMRLGGVHGIPSSAQKKLGSPWKKRERPEYFASLRRVCAGADVVVLHANPQLPGQDDVDEGRPGDARRIFEGFRGSRATLLVHGHEHTREVVTVLEETRQIVVNCDCRVVVLLPAALEQPAKTLSMTVVDATELGDACGLKQKLRELWRDKGMRGKPVCLAAVDAAGNSVDRAEALRGDVTSLGLVAFPLTFSFGVAAADGAG
jgi:hypothetical protein